MILIPLTNVSGARLRIAAARLVFEPGQTKKVHPATVQHPAVQKYIGGNLTQGTQETVAKAEPKAPVAPAVNPPPAAPPVSEPIAGNEDANGTVDETPADDPTVTDVTEEETPEDEEITEEETPEDDVVTEEETPEDDDEAEVVADDSDTEESGNLREVFLSAPGITDKNIEAVLEAFDSLDLLAIAEEDDLTVCGISKSYAKRVIDWATAELE